MRLGEVPSGFWGRAKAERALCLVAVSVLCQGGHVFWADCEGRCKWYAGRALQEGEARTVRGDIV
ncbi:hypothetical protein [Bartonella rattaustraliani]|uniref:hypothetical protein n=1 Tax=Bartonella rattaustraliani TaxID=481139 RepID=UPI00030EDC77|nr:hypothetical protein [Bartonella rattaustraliani]